ncbi:phosphatase PAP2 family protein [Streptomyces gramineus]|uniref:phosphatase PAP2 family protein n=1 Tax=Streptomyces gramineus TaxID=910542 RepID=UPI00398B6CC9
MTDKRAIRAAACALALFIVFYLLAVWTPAGQGLENELLKRSERNVLVEHPDYRPSHISPPILGAGHAVVAGLLLACVALVRLRPRPALWATATTAGAAGSALLLKNLLPRPRYGSAGTELVGNSAPSGHVTMATVVAVVALVVSPPVIRYLTAAAGGVVATLTAYFVQSSGWHRPSDVLTGAALAVFWALVASAFIPAGAFGHLRRQGPDAPAGRSALLLACLVVPSAASLWWASGQHVSPGTLVLVSSAAPCAAVAAFAALAPRPRGGTSGPGSDRARPALHPAELGGAAVLLTLIAAAPFTLSGRAEAPGRPPANFAVVIDPAVGARAGQQRVSPSEAARTVTDNRPGAVVVEVRLTVRDGTGVWKVRARDGRTVLVDGRTARIIG